MTPLEDRVREALAGKAREFPRTRCRRYGCPPGAGASFLSPTEAVREKKRLPAGAGWRLSPPPSWWPRSSRAPWRCPTSCTSAGGAASSLDAAAARSDAASWVAAQVSRSTMVSCDPVMCRAIASRGFPAAYLDEVLPGKVYIWASGVVVATAAVRRDFHGTLSSSYAPGIIASFGSGASQVDVRVVDPGGSASYKAAVSADQQARKLTGAELANNPGIDASVVARRQLRAGRVDSRVMTILAGLAATHPLVGASVRRFRARRWRDQPTAFRRTRLGQPGGWGGASGLQTRNNGRSLTRNRPPSIPRGSP